MENGKNNINDTASNNRTMEYNNVTKSIINQTLTEVDNDTKLEGEARDLAKKAENKLRRRCCLYVLIHSKEERLIESCQLYKRAGDKFKMCNQWKKAGLCYENSALIKIRLKEKPINFYKLAYNCYDKIDIGNEAKVVFDKMNACLEKDKNYFQVAKNCEELAIQKEIKKKYEEAMDLYFKSSIYYEKDGKHENLKNEMKIKSAELMMKIEHEKASKEVPTILENVAVNYLKIPQKENDAKELLGEAILCNLYFKDNPNIGNILIDKYNKIDKSFQYSNIYNLCIGVINSMENHDFKKLNDVIQQYKESYEIDQFMEDILDKIIEKEKKINNIKDSLSSDFNNYEDD